MDAVAAPKLQTFVIALTRRHKQMTAKDLGWVAKPGGRQQWKLQENLKCRTMHIQCTPVPRESANTKPMAGSGQSWALCERKNLLNSNCCRSRCEASPAGNGTEATDR